MPWRSLQGSLTVVGLAEVVLSADCSVCASQSTDAPNVPETVAAPMEATAQTKIIAAAVEASVEGRRSAAPRQRPRPRQQGPDRP